MPTRGDARCITSGHLIRLAIWNLRHEWRPQLPTSEKVELIRKAVASLGGAASVERLLPDDLKRFAGSRESGVREANGTYGASQPEISF